MDGHTLHKYNLGIWIICFFSTLGFIVATYNFFLPTSNISHTGGAALVMLTTITMAVLSVAVFFFRHLHARWERVSLYIVIAILLLGTLFAAYLLESWILLALLVLAGTGLLIQLVTR